MIGPLAAYPVTQLGFVVPDLDEAVRAFGGTWQRPEIPPDTFQDVVYRGGTAALDHLVALSDAGPPQLELRLMNFQCHRATRCTPSESGTLVNKWIDANLTILPPDGAIEHGGPANQ
jgi:hypothetical protein